MKRMASVASALVLGTLLMAVVASRDLQADGLAGIQTADLSEFRFDVGQSGCPVSTYGAGTACPRAIRAPACLPAAFYCCSTASVPGLASCFPQADSSGATSSGTSVQQPVNCALTSNLTCSCSWGTCVTTNAPVPCGTRVILNASC